jgi:Domain of unknown function (DUF4936)
MDLYIYYRVCSSDAPGLQACISDMHAALRHKYDVTCSLKRQAQEKDGRQTWMEVYLSIPDGFEHALQRAVTDALLAPLIDGVRHTEYFVDVKSCA